MPLPKWTIPETLHPLFVLRSFLLPFSMKGTKAAEIAHSTTMAAPANKWGPGKSFSARNLCDGPTAGLGANGDTCDACEADGQLGEIGSKEPSVEGSIAREKDPACCAGSTDSTDVGHSTCWT